MSAKQVIVITPGGDVKVHVGITPETTAADVLREAGLERDFFLFPSRGDMFFQGDEKIAPHVADGDELYANPPARVGADSRTLQGKSSGVLGFFRRLLGIDAPPHGGQKNASRVRQLKRAAPTPERSFLHRVGWRRRGDWHYGKFSVGRRKLRGQVYFRSKWEFRFTVLAPEKLIVACGLHKSCFIPKSEQLNDGTRWYEIHFSSRPGSVASGILAVQKMLTNGDHLMKEQVA